MIRVLPFIQIVAILCKYHTKIFNACIILLYRNRYAFFRVVESFYFYFFIFRKKLRLI